MNKTANTKLNNILILFALGLSGVACGSPEKNRDDSAASNIPTQTTVPSTTTMIPTLEVTVQLEESIDQNEQEASEPVEEIEEAPQVEKLLQEAAEISNSVTAYEFDYEYYFDADIEVDESNEGDLHISVYCNVDAEENNAHCTGERTTGEDGQLIGFNFEFVKRQQLWWARELGGEWQEVTGIQMPGFIEGLIDPTSFLTATFDVNKEGEYLLPNGTFIEISFASEVGTFLDLLFTDDESNFVLDNGDELTAGGQILIGKEDMVIYEFEGGMSFEVDDVQKNLWLTLSYRELNEIVTIPDPTQ